MTSIKNLTIFSNFLAEIYFTFSVLPSFGSKLKCPIMHSSFLINNYFNWEFFHSNIKLYWQGFQKNGQKDRKRAFLKILTKVYSIALFCAAAVGNCKIHAKPKIL
jgi:hypothetical protein